MIWFGPSSLNPAVPQGQGAAAGGVANLVVVMVQLKPCPCENLPEPSFEVSRFFPPDFSTESLHRAFIQGWIGVDAAGDGKAGGVQSLACDFVSPVLFSASILYKEQIHGEKRDSFLFFSHRAHDKAVEFMGTCCHSGQKCKVFRKELRHSCSEGSPGRSNVWHRKSATHLFLGTREVF